jgi:O-Antigen ligase/PDZ domain
LTNNDAAGSPAQPIDNKQPIAKRPISFFAGLLASNSPSGGARRESRVEVFCDRVMTLCLLAYAVFAPHSIALTQGAFLLGLVAWATKMAASRDFSIKKTPVDVALLGFFACCVISSFLSYEPLVSIKGLRSPAFFLAFYFVSNRVRSVRFAGLLAFLIIASCLVNVAYSAGQVAAGRGLHVDSITKESPFASRGLQVGDVIIEAAGQRVDTQEDLYRIIESQKGLIQIRIQRGESVLPAHVSKLDVSEAPGTSVEKLGITTSAGRNFRVTGFYSHYETYAEVLQMIAALAIGLLIAYPKKRSLKAGLLGLAIVLTSGALIMTSTRAAMLGLIAAITVMALATMRRRIVIAATVAILALAPVALFAIERSRGIGLFDPEEGSTAYRLEVWREAFRMIEDHPVAGIGKGSEGSADLRRRYGLYREGELPPGHFHSTLIQIATWWGLPALLLYSSMMVIFAVEIWRLGKIARASGKWGLWGIVLGGLGALIAFNVSSLVHFNFGDGEVVMAFWMILGLVFAVRRMLLERRDDLPSEHIAETPLEVGSCRNQLPEPETASELSARAAKARQNL